MQAQAETKYFHYDIYITFPYLYAKGQFKNVCRTFLETLFLQLEVIIEKLERRCWLILYFEWFDFPAQFDGLNYILQLIEFIFILGY